MIYDDLSPNRPHNLIGEEDDTSYRIYVKGKYSKDRQRIEDLDYEKI